MASRRLYVGYGLPRDLTEKEVEDVFYKFGKLSSIWIARNPPGFCYVEYEDPEAGEAAMRGADGAVIAGVKIRVEPAKNQGPRPGRGGPPGGRGGGSGGGFDDRRPPPPRGDDRGGRGGYDDRRPPFEDRGRGGGGFEDRGRGGGYDDRGGRGGGAPPVDSGRRSFDDRRPPFEDRRPAPAFDDRRRDRSRSRDRGRPQDDDRRGGRVADQVGHEGRGRDDSGPAREFPVRDHGDDRRGSAGGADAGGDHGHGGDLLPPPHAGDAPGDHADIM